MKVALVHYHLRTGGVTKVIQNQSRALTAAGIDHLILSSGPPERDFPCAVIPDLDYAETSERTATELHSQLLTAFQEQFGSPPDLWHIHNPTLGKNILFPGLIEKIAESETPLILQTHDFAEDNRPTNYPLLEGLQIYPIAPQIHYAFINSRDRALLIQAGLPAENSHLLINTVATGHHFQDAPPRESDENLVLYPVRGIRRKNVGEVILLAALAPAGTRFAISLAPENEKWQAIHNRWEAFSKAQRLPVEFDVTNRVPPYPGEPSHYQSWQKHATHLLTTSIAEGFGLTFLEPATLAKPLLGRDLPEVTFDFCQQGIQAGRLYETIPVPLEHIDTDSLKEELRERLTATYELYQQPFHQDFLLAVWEEMVKDHTIDFGKLPERFQEEVILKAIETPESFPIRDWLHSTLKETKPTATTSQLEPFSAASTGTSLQALYETAVESPSEPPNWLPKTRVLEQYLSPERFHFLRS